ncbi:putative copper-transporting ATPase 3-like protein [Corchorus olitorius]|uniref:Copper-transporting ATPase 3-like protein n=1 Tax=Corchorus olitorius TaxID=93759 RepID=A0A1R3HNF9_9ROSI|nr:putative copper-transporting ATPase 3-like protein [Corchorus olitorius]
MYADLVTVIKATYLYRREEEAQKPGAHLGHLTAKQNADSKPPYGRGIRQPESDEVRGATAESRWSGRRRWEVTAGSGKDDAIFGSDLVGCGAFGVQRDIKLSSDPRDENYEIRSSNMPVWVV